MTSINKDYANLFLCEEVLEGSHDPNRRVGVVIVNTKNVVLSTGTNAPPTRMGLKREDSHRMFALDPQSKYFLLEHAERNAIHSAYHKGKSLSGATIYSTLFPCADCARAIVAAGIERLVVPAKEIDPIRDEKWLDHYRHARKIFELAGVEIDSLAIEADSQLPKLKAEGM